MAHRLLVWSVRRAGWSQYGDDELRALSVKSITGAMALDGSGHALAGGLYDPGEEQGIANFIKRCAASAIYRLSALTPRPAILALAQLWAQWTPHRRARRAAWRFSSARATAATLTSPCRATTPCRACTCGGGLGGDRGGAEVHVLVIRRRDLERL
jgi:hypothetical protein